MQKKIIALAVAGLVSGAAFAQSNVTIYGILDAGVKYDGGAATGSKNGFGTQSGSLDDSRIGFKGTEDLGNGLKAGFDFAEGFHVLTGNSSGNMMTEQSALWLGGNFGTVKAGYFSSIFDSDISGVDVSGRHGPVGADALFGTGYWSSHVQYISPDLSGLKLMAGYSANVGGDWSPLTNASTPSATANIRAYELGGVYVNGPVKVGLGYANYAQDVSNDNGQGGKVYEWHAGAAYDFKVAAVSLYYATKHRDQDAYVTGVMDISANSGLAGDAKSNSTWALAVAAPLTPADNLAFSYGSRKIDTYSGAADHTTRDWGLFYTHNLSKRTLVYAMFGTASGDDKYIYDASGVGTGYTTQVTAGLHHTF